MNRLSLDPPNETQVREFNSSQEDLSRRFRFGGDPYLSRLEELRRQLETETDSDRRTMLETEINDCRRAAAHA